MSLRNDHLHQLEFVPKANAVLSELKRNLFSQSGICAALVNIYIKFASQGRRDEFFQYVSFNSSDLYKLKKFR